jgi:phospholipid/cholesterol/gamma-HCH transport system ATP-binding protein
MIVLENVTKAFGEPVLRGVDLTIPEGSLYGLIGPGASGKSIVLKIMAGLVAPDSGRVRVGDLDVTAMTDDDLTTYRRDVGMLFQNNALFDFMTVFDNVAFPLRRLFDLSEGETRRRVMARLESVGLAAFEARLPGGLSGGQKKRVGVARATVTAARVLLYDEPAAGLDPVTSQRIFDLLRVEQTRSRATVVMVSSDIDRLLTVTDRVGMLLAGELIFDGTTEEARNSRDPFVHQFVHGEVEGPLA